MSWLIACKCGPNVTCHCGGGLSPESLRVETLRRYNRKPTADWDADAMQTDELAALRAENAKLKTQLAGLISAIRHPDSPVRTILEKAGIWQLFEGAP